MSNKYNGTGEPVYTIISRHKDALKMFSSWSRNNTCKVKIAENKMHLYDQRSYDVFLVTWKHSLDNILVWDHWNRRHLSL